MNRSSSPAPGFYTTNASLNEMGAGAAAHLRAACPADVTFAPASPCRGNHLPHFKLQGMMRQFRFRHGTRHHRYLNG